MCSFLPQSCRFLSDVTWQTPKPQALEDDIQRRWTANMILDEQLFPACIYIYIYIVVIFFSVFIVVLMSITFFIIRILIFSSIIIMVI